MTKKITVAIAGDFHIPSALGLCPPVLRHDDGWTSQYSKTQRWIGESFSAYVSAVKSAAKGGRLYVVLNGDIAEVDAKDRSWQLITRNPETIREAVSECLDPLVSPADRLFVVRGTEAHGGKSNWIEGMIASDWSNAVPDDAGSKAHWFLYADFGGVYFDIAHHIGGDGQEWTTDAAMVRLAKSTVIKYAERGLAVPQIVVRGHMHRYKDSYGASPICRAITAPGWTALGAHEFRLGSNGMLADVGGLIVTIEAGRAEVRIVTYPPARRTAWREK